LAQQTKGEAERQDWKGKKGKKGGGKAGKIRFRVKMNNKAESLRKEAVPIPDPPAADDALL